jgi:hypothetical protein
MARLLLSECPNGSWNSSTDLACHLWSFGLVADWPFGFHFDAWLQDSLSMSDPGLAGELYTNLNGLTRPPFFRLVQSLHWS